MCYEHALRLKKRYRRENGVSLCVFSVASRAAAVHNARFILLVIRLYKRLVPVVRKRVFSAVRARWHSPVRRAPARCVRRARSERAARGAADEAVGPGFGALRSVFGEVDARTGASRRVFFRSRR